MPNTVAEVPLATQAHTNPLLDADDAFAAVFNDEEEETALPAKGIFYGNQYPQLPQDEFLKPLIENYFWKGYSNKAITDLLEDLHGVKISERTLKRRLATWNLKRSTAQYIEIGEDQQEQRIIEAIAKEIEGINSRVGYREMTRYLREKHQIVAKEDHVALLLKMMDPAGTAERKKHSLGRRIAWSAGPNDRWCFDGHDKLNKYFLAIHGCKDFWSGKWIWLRVFVSNHDPRVILLYYLEAVKEHQVFPLSTGSDRGTETVDVAAMQAALHDVHKSGFSIALAHRYVPSTRNTKIESAWTRWLKARGYTLAEVLAAGFEYPSSWEENDQLDKYIYLYVWIPFTQSILDEYAEHVNNNKRRANKNCLLPSAAPFLCYSSPNRFGGLNCGIPVADMSWVDNAIATLRQEKLITEYIPQDVKNACDIAFSSIGSPAVSLNNAWEIVYKIKDVFMNV